MLVPWRVYQRGDDGTADVVVRPSGIPESATIVEASLGLWSGRDAGTDLEADVGIDVDEDLTRLDAVRFVEGRLRDVPTGGPYEVRGRYRLPKTDDPGEAVAEFVVGPIFVGDLWVLAGQSNIEGQGLLNRSTPEHPLVGVLGMDHRWSKAIEPLHRLEVSPDPAHRKTERGRLARRLVAAGMRTRGVGPGLAFASRIADQAGVPIGLITCAHGGTNLRDWSPSGRGAGASSFYGSMCEQVARAGGRVAGLVWYQGENEAVKADAGEVASYQRRLVQFLKAVRRDWSSPDLPVLMVQLARYVARPNDQRDEAWNAIRRAQLEVAEQTPQTWLVATIDLSLSDRIHLGSEDQRVLGRRLGDLALAEVYGEWSQGSRVPRPVHYQLEPGITGPAIRIRFEGVNRRGTIGLRTELRIAGFSIRSVRGTPTWVIVRVEVDPKAPEEVVLHVFNKLPAQGQLWYGYGMNPMANLRDAAGQAVPAFGPVPLASMSYADPESDPGSNTPPQE